MESIMIIKGWKGLYNSYRSATHLNPLGYTIKGRFTLLLDLEDLTEAVEYDLC